MTMMKMARSNSTQAPEEAAPSSWLREFVNGEERAFNELVNHYSFPTTSPIPHRMDLSNDPARDFKGHEKSTSP